MSDIIPFPQNNEKLIKDIKTFFEQEKYEQMYDAFMNYEREFELTTELALLKCEMLLRMEQYLELREEAIVLLKQGYDAYDKLMVYYMTSLHGLGQYFECVEVFNQIIDQVKDHNIRMQLFPIKEDAQMQLNENKKRYIARMKQFPDLKVDQQLYLIFDLMHEGQFGFTDTFAELLSTHPFHTNVQTIILEYLKKGQYNKEVKFTKYEAEFTVQPDQLPGLEYAVFTQQVIPNIMERFENNYGDQLRSEIAQMLQNFSIALYPLEIEKVASIKIWIDSFYVYLEKMLNLSFSPTENINDKVNNWIEKVQKNIK
ncbi:hypothetical protein AMC75_00905 [Staphylococcus carnosus]|uniref:hypothetical protein n=1 Tax=Staphylococcus carnosus TaxID=1281 RepID=UPI0006ABEC2F|nr:hypothetical protein [Staphylococcus carnosus]KOR13458.1 hypothetical protein AMC75_00905 [Staphylococcus carnosus]